MPDDSQGNYSRPAGNWPQDGQLAEASQVNAPVNDLSASMSRRLMRDGRAPMLGNLNMNGYRVVGGGAAVDGGDYITKAQVESLIASIASVPTGIMTPISGTATPAGWVRANGQSLSRTTYADLWAFAQASGNLAATQGAKTAGQYGPGNGATTFTVPNLEADGGYFIRPVSSGRNIGTVQQDAFKSHDHNGTLGNAANRTVTIAGSTAGNSGGNSRLLVGDSLGTPNRLIATSLQDDHSHSLTISSTGGSETRPQNIAYPVIIKT